MLGSPTQTRLMRTSPLSLPTSIRSINPATTLSAIEPYISSIGLTGIKDHTLLTVPSIPIYEAVRTTTSRSDYFCLGKGFGADASRASCLMEAMEMHLVESQLVKPSGTWGELKESSGFYRRRWDAPRLKRDVSDDIGHGEPVFQGYDLRSGHEIFFLGRDLFYASNNQSHSLHGPTTNGLASGNNQDEARVHALCELIERDALHRWNLRLMLLGYPQVFEEVGLEGLDEPLAGAITELLQAGFHVHITRLPSPQRCFVYEAAVMMIVDDCSVAALTGWGAHPIESIAMNRAVAECVQILAIHQAIREDRITVDELPGRSSSHRQRCLSLGDLNMFIKPIPVDNIRQTPRLWKYEPSSQSPDIDYSLDIDHANLISSILSGDTGFTAAIEIAPDQYPFSSQIVVASKLATPPGF